MKKARLVIDIWKDGTGRLPDDLGTAFQPHVEHIAGLLSDGFTSGDVYQEGEFRGWWKIEETP